MVAFCLFGAGLIGTVHAANIAAHPGADLRTVVDIDAAAGRALADKHGATFSENAEAANRPEIARHASYVLPVPNSDLAHRAISH